MNIIFNFSMVQKIDEFCKKAEKLFDAIEGEAIPINFLSNNGEFIDSKFIPNSFNPKKYLKN